MNARRSIRRYFGMACLCLSLAFPSMSLAQSAPTGLRIVPPGCPAHLVCFTTDEWKEIRTKMINQEKERDQLKAIRGGKFGGVLGCGGVYAFQIGGSDIDFDFAPACGAMWGWRF